MPERTTAELLATTEQCPGSWKACPANLSGCDIEVGPHPWPGWVDKNSNLRVCSRHKAQYEEREDEFGPFNWAPQTSSQLAQESGICVYCGGRFWRDTKGRLLPHLRKRRDDG